MTKQRQVSLHTRLLILNSPHLGISLKHRGNQRPAILTNLPTREAILIIQYPFVRTLNILTFIRRLAHQHREANNTHTSNIHLEGMSTLFLIPLDYFGCNVVGSAGDSLAFFIGRIDTTCQTKVANLNIHSLAQK